MKDEIASKLQDLRKYHDILISYKKCSIKQLERDHTIRGAVERYLQLCLEITIEIGEMIISEEGFEKPSKNREIAEILGKHGVIQKNFAKKFAPSAGLRNILVHRYGSVDVYKLYNFLQNHTNDFEMFSKYISKYSRKWTFSQKSTKAADKVYTLSAMKKK